MSDVIELIKYKPVHYTVYLSHDERGFSVQVADVSDESDSRKRVARDLRHAADLIDGSISDQPGDQ